MYKIAIENKDGEKYEFECDGTANLYVFTEELGIKEYPYSLKIGENRNGVKVRLRYFTRSGRWKRKAENYTGKYPVI